eukprot:GILK01010236.1.p1 GENE.GILK01010236.1~~GILK01010236.1.p1  ORF type:complete len:505 (-),score=83.56 GILK01010236.1:99-1613(-)
MGDNYFARRESFAEDTRRLDRQTKIVCTIGMATKSVESICSLIYEGMNIARFDMTHESHQFYREVAANVRSAADSCHAIIPILVDLQGATIRTGELPNHQSLLLAAGSTLLFTVSDSPTEMDAAQDDDDSIPRVRLNNKQLPSLLKQGDQLLIDDGSFSTTVLNTTTDSITCKVDSHNAILGEFKTVHLPSVKLDLPPLTPKDVKDVAFAVEIGADFIAGSVKSTADLALLRQTVAALPNSEQISLIAKIDSQQGLDCFDSILAETDSVMVARGDLGVEIPLERVCTAQKIITRKCNLAGKPVITSMQLLESMVNTPYPTRAEATDVANAVFDGTDAVILSDETAIGQYPIDAVHITSKICSVAEKSIDYGSLFLSILTASRHSIPTVEAVTSSAVKTAFDLRSPLMVVLTETGVAARATAKYRPFSPVIVLTASQSTARRCCLSRGLFSFVVERKTTEQVIKTGIELGKQRGMCAPGDQVVAVSGVKEGVSGATDQMKVVIVD